MTIVNTKFNSSRTGFLCCKNCARRFPGCSTTCESYKAVRAEYDARKTKYKQAKEKERLERGLETQRCIRLGYKFGQR